MPRIELRPYATAVAAGHNATCRLEVTLADSRALAISKTDIDDDATSGGLQQRIERKYATLAAGLGEARRSELLRRLNTIEDCAIAGLFAL